jgi:hypothetical protein
MLCIQNLAKPETGYLSISWRINRACGVRKNTSEMLDLGKIDREAGLYRVFPVAGMDGHSGAAEWTS